jgi:hypothetical protein
MTVQSSQVPEGELEPGQYADELGNEITVLRQVHDGLYEVTQSGSQERYTLSGCTIRALYPGAA